MMLITLSGLDGAGKSTLAEALKASLERGGTQVVILHMNKDVGLYAYIRNIRDSVLRIVRPTRRKTSGSGAPRLTPDQTRNNLERAWLEARRRIIWNKPLRKLVDLGDLAMFQVSRLYIERMRGRVLIMDRYFYDRLADQADGKNWRYLRWFAGITPRPDLPILVDVPPEEAFGRKGEYSVESMTLRRANYREIFSWVSASIVLSNDDLAVTTGMLEQLVRRHFGALLHRRAVAGR